MPQMTLSVTYTRTIEVCTTLTVDVPDDVLADEDTDVEDALYDYLEGKTELFDGKGDEEETSEEVALDTVEILD